VFASQRDGNWEIYVMNADGSGQTRLTNNSADDGHPVWQPKTTGTVALPTIAPTVAASRTPVPPTRAPATATLAAPPGVYVIGMQTDPAEPKQKQNIAFRVTFFNNLGAQANMKWYVKIFEPDKTQSFGETDKTDSQIPVGTSVFVSAANWKMGGGVPSKQFIARVYSVQPNGIVPYEKPEGGNFEYYFTVSP
jgi:hypothetical protein